MSTAPLTLTPLSAVACDAVLCRQAGALWATVVVKATFQLVHGETARLVAPLGLVHRDQMGAGGSLVAARETAPHVPNAGVVVTGHACAPGGGASAVASMSVRLGVSRERPLVDKTLHVFGPRAAGNPSAVMPFQKMPIVYERAFGGPGVWENPVGTGGPGSRALPNIVDPKDARRPAGFGPVAGAWMPRRRLLGGADQAALEQAIFEPPRGFDWQYFQAAPADQQLDTLRGDEWILLDGMHPTLPRVQTRLPQARAQARRTAAEGVAGDAVELRADMLVIDADSLMASMVWRGRFPAGSVEALRSVRVLVGLEVGGRPIDWGAGGRIQVSSASAQAETQEVNLGTILGGSLPFDANRESALPPPSAKAAPAAFSTGTAAVDVSKILQGPVPFGETARPAAPASFKAEGPPSATETVMAIPALSLVRPQAVPFVAADPNKPPVEASASHGAPKSTPMHTGTTDINLAEVMKSVMPYRGEPKAQPSPSAPGASPPPVAPPPPPAASVVPASMAAAAAPVASFTPIAAVAPPAPLAPVAPPAPLAPVAPVAPPAPTAPAPPVAPRASLPLAMAASNPPAFPSPAPAEPGAAAVASTTTSGHNEVRAAVLERLATGQSLEGLRLVGADLHDIDFKGASLIGLDLQKARLAGAKLQEARLSQARLVGADLTGADLSGADLGRADLSRAVLDGAKLDRSVLIGARLCEARGKGGSFVGGRLAQADLQGAELHETAMLDIDAPESVWDKASLDGSRLLGAKLRGASFQRARLHGVCFSQADLTSASFQRAAGNAVDLRAAKLEAADLRQAQLPDAKLDDADMRDVSATKADLSGARFFRAELAGANLRAAKLNGADLLHAKLDGADLRDAELQGVKIDPAAARAAKIRLPR